jgi:hypothetical protein
MPISVVCEGCGKRYTAKDEWAGKALRCKSCGSVVRVPEAEVDLLGPDLSDLEAEAPPAPLQPVLGSKPVAKRKVAFRLSALGTWKIPVVVAADPAKLPQSGPFMNRGGPRH